VATSYQSEFRKAYNLDSRHNEAVETSDVHEPMKRPGFAW
jgi:hypothetical protein